MYRKARVYTIGTRAQAVQRSSAFLRLGGRSSCEIIGRKRGNGLEVTCRYTAL